MIYLASDHGGYAVKQRLARWLPTLGVEVHDIGPRTRRPQDDYPLWAVKVARLVRRSPESRGILVCRSGVGMAIVANKVPGIRASQASNPTMARRARQDEDTNVLSIAADYQSWPEIQRIVRTWLKTPFRPLVRYRRRLKQITSVERAR